MEAAWPRPAILLAGSQGARFTTARSFYRKNAPENCRSHAGRMPVQCRLSTALWIALALKEDAVRKIQLDGRKVKELRDNRDRAATQKELAHEIRISERKLRAIENSNAPVSAEIAERIARALSTPLPLLTRDCGDGPPPAAVAVTPGASMALEKVVRKRIVPRFDEDYAYAISDEAFLFEKIRPCRNLVSHIFLSLTAETSSYVEELLSVLRSLTWEERGRLTPIDALEEVAIRRRMRELLVLLKGNDVWLYFYDNFRTLPESCEAPPESTRCENEFQAVVVFGPPGEYGEITIKVPIDRGQPWVFAE
jgi:DNA-binding XRE family transcriptional regulator